MQIPVRMKRVSQTIPGILVGSGKLVEYGSTCAYLLKMPDDYNRYVKVNNIDYIIPSEGYQNWVQKVHLLNDSEFLQFSLLPFTVRKYQIDGSTIVKTGQTVIGSNDARFIDCLRLDSGATIVSWHLQIAGTTKSIYFSYSPDGLIWTTHEAIVTNTSSIPATSGTICRHPADGSIWSFTLSDGSKNVHAVRLSEVAGDIQIDWVNSFFTTYSYIDGLLSREGEFPKPVAIPDPVRNTIVLAYQNMAYKLFSINPFFKGANIVTMDVFADGTRTLRKIYPVWVERVSNFALDLNWLAGSAIDETITEGVWKPLICTLWQDGKEPITLPALLPVQPAIGAATIQYTSNRLLYSATDGIREVRI